MDKQERIITPSDLKADLDAAEKAEDLRMFLLYANLYNEYFVNILHKNYFKDTKYNKCIKCQKLIITKLKRQVADLAEIKIIPSEHGHDKTIKLIYELRNEIAHNLTITTKELEKIFIENEEPIYTDTDGIIKKFLDNASPWNKIKMSVFATVTSLYHQYEKLNDRIPKQTIHFTLNPETFDAQIVIKPYSK